MSDLRKERERAARRWAIIAAVSSTAVLAILTFYLATRVCATAIYGAVLGRPWMCGVTETLSWLNRGAPRLLWPLAIVFAFFVARAILRDLR